MIYGKSQYLYNEIKDLMKLTKLEIYGESDWSEGLKLISEKKIEVVVLEIHHLPLEPIDTLLAFKEVYPALRFIILSPCHMESLEQVYTRHGALLLTRPLLAKHLREALSIDLQDVI